MTQQTLARYDSRTQQTQVEMPLNPSRKRFQWQEIFKKYDLDSDGRISLAELRAMILSESYENDIPDPTVRRIMQRADEDQNGYLDIHEFERMYWMYIFDKYDVDKNGKISLHELQALLHKKGDREIPRKYVNKLLRASDVNQDGFLTFDEFNDLVHSKEFRSLMGQMVNTYIRSTVVPRYDEPDARGDYEDEYSCWPPSLCMVLVSLIEVGTFIYDVAKEEKRDASGPAAKVFIYNPCKRYEVWRWLTYMFVHVGVMHLVVNLLVQILLGMPLEMVHKWWRVLIIYFAGVLAGSLGTSISDPSVLLAGASGGVYALITAHVASIIMNWSEMRFALLQLVVFFILTGSDVGTAIYNRYVLQSDSPIGYAAHLAGAVAGLLVGINVLRNLQQKKWEKVVWWISLVAYCALMLAAIIWNVAYPEYFCMQNIK